MSGIYTFSKSELESHMRNKYQHPRDYASLPPGQPLGKNGDGTLQKPKYGCGKGTLADPLIEWLCDIPQPLDRKLQCEEICTKTAKEYGFAQVYIRAENHNTLRTHLNIYVPSDPHITVYVGCGQNLVQLGGHFFTKSRGILPVRRATKTERNMPRYTGDDEFVELWPYEGPEAASRAAAKRFADKQANPKQTNTRAPGQGQTNSRYTPRSGPTNSRAPAITFQKSGMSNWR